MADKKKYKVNEQLIGDFVATIDSKPNLTKQEIFSKFPEFKNDEGFLQSMVDYRATLKSGKYKSEVEARVKFPEFEFGDVKKKDLSTQGSASGFAPSQGIKPGTSIFPQQVLSKESQEFAPMPVEKRYKQKAASKPIAQDLGVMNNYVGYIAGKLMESGVTMYPNIEAAVTDIGDYLQSKITGENIYTLRPGGMFGPTYQLEGLSPQSKLALQQGRQEQIDAFGDVANVLTTKKYEEDLAKRAEDKGIVSGEFATQALGSIGESVVSNFGTAGFGFFADMFNDMNIEGKKNGLTEGEALAHAGLISGAVSLVDKAGLGFLFKSAPKPVKEKLGKYVAAKALSSLSKSGLKITEETIEKAMQAETKKLKTKLLTTGVKATLGGITEAGTETAQEGIAIGGEQLMNLIKGKEVFNSGDIVDRIVKSAAGGFIGGKVVGGIQGFVGDGETYNFIKEGVAETYNNPDDYNDFRVELSSQLQEQNIPEATQEKILAEVDKMKDRELSIPEEAENKDAIRDILSKRDMVLSEIVEIDATPTDPAFAKENEKKKATLQGAIDALNDAAVAAKGGITIQYRQTDGEYQKVINNKIEPITQEQYEYAEAADLPNIKVYNQDALFPINLDEIEDQGGAVTTQGGAVTEEGGAVDIENRLADIETELQDPDITEERIQELNTEKEQLNATKESSQQVIQGGEQGNQLQREGTQEGQPQAGQGEGSQGQTTQPETDNRDSDQQGEGEVITGKKRGFIESVENAPATEPIAESFADDPASFYDPQTIAEGDDIVGNMTEAEKMQMVDELFGVNNAFKDKNVAILAGISLINDYIAQGKNDMAEAVVKKMAEIGTFAGQLIQQFSTLKSSNPISFTFALQKVLNKFNIKLTDAQKQKLEAMFVDTKSAADNAQKAIEKYAKDLDPVSKAEMYKAIQAHEDAVMKMEMYLERILPASTFQTLGGMMQGNMLVFKSLLANPVYNLLFKAVSIPKNEIASALDWLFSNYAFKTKDRTIRSNFDPDVLKRTIGAIKQGILNAKRKAIKGSTSGEMDRFDRQRNLRPVEAAKQLKIQLTDMINLWADKNYQASEELAKKEGQKVDVDRLVSNLLQISPPGLLANLMLRGLPFGDDPFSEPARLKELINIGKNKGLKGDALESFIINPDKESADAAVEAAKGAVFQEDNYISKSVNAINRALDQMAPEFPVLSEALKFVVVKTTLPFVKTPSNVLNETLNYGVPAIPLVKSMVYGVKARHWDGEAFKAEQALKKAIKEGKPIKDLKAKVEMYKKETDKNRRLLSDNLAKFAMSIALLSAGIWLSSKGVIEGDDEEDEDKKMKAWRWATAGGPNSINISLLNRLKDDPNAKPLYTDKRISLQSLGLPGAVFFIAHESLKDKTKNVGKIDFETGQLIQSARALSNQVLSPLSTAGAAGGFILDQGFAQGAGALANAVSNNEWDKYFNQIARAGTTAFLPNSIDQFSRVNRDYLKVPYTEKPTETFLNQMKIKFGQDENLPVRRGLFGEPIKQNPKGANPTVYQFIDIFRTSDAFSAPVYFELNKLFEESKKVMGNNRGDADLIPSVPTRDISLDGKTYYLNQEYYDKYLEMIGVERLNLLQEVLDNNTEGWSIELSEQIKNAYEVGFIIGQSNFIEKYESKLGRN